MAIALGLSSLEFIHPQLDGGTQASKDRISEPTSIVAATSPTVPVAGAILRATETVVIFVIRPHSTFRELSTRDGQKQRSETGTALEQSGQQFVGHAGREAALAEVDGVQGPFDTTG